MPLFHVEEILNPSQINEQERQLAWKAHMGCFTIIIGLSFLSFLIPLFILSRSGDSEFIKRNAKEALNFQLTFLIGLLIGIGFTMITTKAVIMVGVLWVLNFVFSWSAMTSAKTGSAYQYPINLRII